MIFPYIAVALLGFVTVYSAIVSFKQPVNHKLRWIFPDAASQSTRMFAGALTVALLTGFAWYSNQTLNLEGSVDHIFLLE